MRGIARTLHVVVAWVLVAGLVVQVWLAGRGVFDTTTFAPHREFGYTLSVVPLVLLVLGFVGGMGRKVAGLAAAIFLLFIVQSILVALRTSQPAVAALHPVNGFLIVLLAVLLVRESMVQRTAIA